MVKCEDLTGREFGDLAVLCRGNDHIYITKLGKKKKYIKWVVRCSCGKEYETDRYSLKGRGVSRCRRCSTNFVDLTNKKFGKLLVLREDKNEYRTPKGVKYIKWICKCDCGVIYSVLGEHLKSGGTTQCSKCRYISFQLNGRMSASLFYRIRDNAIKRKFDFFITKEYIWELYLKQNKRCALSGLSIVFAQTIKKERSQRGTTASLDRIDSKKGYIKGNVQWVHKDINKMKFNFDEKYFLHICKTICEYKDREEINQ